MMEWITTWSRAVGWRMRGAVVVSGLVGGLAFASTASAAATPASLSVFAGTGIAGAPTSGPAISSELHYPRGAVVDPSTGDLYIADYGNSEIEKITPEGTLSVIAGTGDYGAPTPGPAIRSDLGRPTGVAVSAAGDLYVADPYQNMVEKITPEGTLSIIAGTSAAGAPPPGPATRSRLDEPYGVAVSQTDGDVYIADYDNSEVERVTPAGSLSIIAGTGHYGQPTPGPATRSALGSPSSVAVDSAGDVYVADPFNDMVEEVSAQGTLHILAGTGAPGLPTPGPAASSALALPHGLAVDPTTGDLYIAAFGNDELLEVTPQSTLSILAGTGTAGASTPGPATRSELDQPLGVGVNPGTGELYLADSANNEIDQVGPACPVPSGRLTGIHLGPVALGVTRAQARRALPTYTVAHDGSDDFCLAGGPGIVAGYPSARLLRSVSARERTRLRLRVALALTANPRYALDHISAGARLSRVRRRLAHAERLRAGGHLWYLLPGLGATGVLEIRHGTVSEIGIASHALTVTRAQRHGLMSGV